MTLEPPNLNKSDDATENRAFRLRRSILEVLNKEAEERGLTANALVNEVLLKYVKWDSPRRRTHPVSISSVLLKRLTESIS